MGFINQYSSINYLRRKFPTKKMEFIIILFALIFAAGGCCGKNKMDGTIKKGLSVSIKQTELMAESLWEKKELLPRTVDKDGNLVTAKSEWWTSGFFPGTLWYLYEMTNDSLLKTYAEDYTLRVEKEKYTTDNHDVGFMLYCSFGNGYRLTHNETYKQTLLTGAASLSTRFNSKTGLIRSWDFNGVTWQYPVIIDNMMNLELLEWATKISDNKTLEDIAQSHANVTMKNHFRPDYSCWHVVSYDTITGVPEKKHTWQGYSNSSCWARGEAWALYGYTMMYRETGLQSYLEQAKNIAHFIIKHPRMPKDGIPYWDFDDPKIPNSLRDASAAAIMASAFVELSTLTDGKCSQEYLKMAEKQLKTLTSSQYLAEPGTNGNFILKHAVGNLPGNTEVDAPLTYADYYYVEALTRYSKCY
jgi:rhamnogalacturonyl hydrolase YesR